MAGQAPYPRLFNLRAYVSDRLETRPGQAVLTTAALDQLNVHTIRRLNDSVPGASLAFTRVVGAGTKLYTGQTSITSVSTGFSGNPLTMIPYRPDQSPEPWMYVSDSSKMVKANVAGTAYQMGISNPLAPPSAELGTPNFKIVYDFNTIGPWSNAAPAGAISLVAMANTTITAIIYNTGSTGWCSIVPAAYPFGLQFHSLVIVNTGGGTQETIQVEEVCPAVTSTTIAAIQYDSGNTGPCSIVMTAPNTRELGLKRNAVILINSGGGTQEYVRVVAAIEGTGNQWSFRASTVNNHVAGETLAGVQSFRAYTVNTHAAAEALNINVFQSTCGVPSPFPAVLGTSANALDLSVINGRPTQPDDQFHISIAVDNPSNVVDGRVFLDVDGTPANQDFNHNYYYWVFRGNDLSAAAAQTTTTLLTQQTGIQRALVDQSSQTAGLPKGAKVDYRISPYGFQPTRPTTVLGSVQGQTVTGNLQFAELVFNVSDLIRVGNDQTRTLANVIKLRITLNVTATTVLQIGAWTLGGSYGPDVGDTGGPLFYRYRYRSSVTGAVSNPSPATRFGVQPHRTQIVVTGTQSADAQVDKVDIFRFGGDITAGWPYVGTTANSATPSFTDIYADSDILNAPLLEFDNFVPFPTIDITRSGTCNVVGTSVVWVSGSTFNTSWSEGSEININGIYYHLYRQPQSTTFLEIVENAGNQSGVAFFLQEATILAQPEPVMWGPYYGQFFAAGDPYQPGYVFRTKGNNPDSAPDNQQDEISTPSEPVMNGCLYNASSYVFTSNRMFAIIPEQNSDGSLGFLYQQVASVGLYSRWALTVGDAIYYIESGGIGIRASGGGDAGQSLTDQDLALLFGHDGQPGVPVQLGSVTFQPPDMAQTSALRLSYQDKHLYFDYIDLSGLRQTMVYNTVLGVWSLDGYFQPAIIHYEEEGQSLHSVLVGSPDGNIYQLSGTQDANMAGVPFSLRMPYFGNVFPSFSHVRDGYIGLISNSATSLALNPDGGTESLVTVPSTAGLYVKVYVVLPPVKAKAWEYGLSGTGPCAIYVDDSYVRQKSWGGEYQALPMFSGISRLGG